MIVLKLFASVNCKHLALFRVIHKDEVLLCSHLKSLVKIEDVFDERSSILL